MTEGERGSSTETPGNEETLGDARGGAGREVRTESTRGSAARASMRRADTFWAGPVIGLCVLALLAGAYAWLGRPHAAKPSAPALIGVIPLGDVAGVSFHAAGKTLAIYRETGVSVGLGEQWRLGSPTGAAADTTLVGGFVTSLLSLQPARVVSRQPTKAELTAWGLNPPATWVRLLRTGGRAAVQLDVGKQSPVSDYYASVVGHPTVYLIDTTVASEISTNPSNWLPIPSTSSGTSASGAASASSATSSGKG